MLTIAQFNRFLVIAHALDLGWAIAVQRSASPGSFLWHARSDIRRALASLAGCTGDAVIDVAWLARICEVCNVSQDGLPAPTPVERLTAEGFVSEPGQAVGDYTMSASGVVATFHLDGTGVIAVGEDVLRLVAHGLSPVYRRRPGPCTDLARQVFRAASWLFTPDGETVWDNFDLPMPEGISLAELSAPTWKPALVVRTYDGATGHCYAYGFPVPCRPWHDGRVSPLVPLWGGEDDPMRFIWEDGRPDTLGRRAPMGPVLMMVWTRDLDAAMRSVARTQAEWPALREQLLRDLAEHDA